ncbi:MAG: YCF48-related protein [Bacteroidia bacterium]|nr:YCF48-related protein [Bacteroidia bacterium]
MNKSLIYLNCSKVLILAVLLLISGSIVARENIGERGKTSKNQRTSGGCAAPTSFAQLDINNVRTTLMNGGDMWWDLVGNPRYEVPKNNTPGATPKHALFAGAIWIGGYDGGGQLRLAAQTYRQTGTDFYPGPLDASAEIDPATCLKYDRHYTVFKSEIDAFINAYQTGALASGAFAIPKNILDWPAKKNLSDPDLAPFEDVDGNGVYDPNSGDYPLIFGDQAIWWVYNDKGNIHSETSAEPIGIEIQTMAFAFVTNDEMNNATFYKSKIINKSTNTLNQTYIGQWVDPDLGNYADDYVGCDTLLGLGFCYNGDGLDEGVSGYGNSLPAIGIDFFEGPIADPGDGIDNDKDGTIDEPGEKIIMSKFVYYNNDFTPYGNPSAAQHFYGYLDGKWKDGNPIVDDGKDGVASTTPNAYTPKPTNYMFPGGLCGGNLGWTEANAGNNPADRRFIQSAGKFTLQPGAVNYVTIGAVFAQGTTLGSNTDAICNLIKADKKAQALFDNNFKRVSGPDAPVVTAVELDRTIILNWDNPINSNNYQEKFEQKDPELVIAGAPDTTYNFEGYLIYQLKDATVSISDLRDPNKARLIGQCDVKNGVTSIINTTVDPVLGPVNTLMVANVPDVSDKGTFKTFKVTTDQFAIGDNRLINNKHYYFMVVAYAYNAYAVSEKFKQSDNAKVVVAMPHLTMPEENGMILNAEYGEMLPITRVRGTGNGGFNIQLDEATINEILAKNALEELTYKKGYGPIQVRVIDPKKVKELDYQLVIPPQLDRWFLIDRNTKDSIYYSGNSGPFNAITLTSDGTTNRVYVFGASGNISRSFSPTVGNMNMQQVRRISSFNINAADAINVATNNRDIILGVGDRGNLIYAYDSTATANSLFKTSKLATSTGEKSDKLTAVAISGDYNGTLQNVLIVGVAKNTAGQTVTNLYSMRLHANTIVKNRPSWNALSIGSIISEEYVAAEYVPVSSSGNPTAWIGGTASGVPKIKWADNSVFATSSPSSTWNDAVLPAGLTGTIKAIYMKNSTNGYAVGTNGIFLTTTDGGKNWTNSASALPNLNNITLNAIHFNGTTGLIVGDKGKVYFTTDDGATWNEDRSLQNKSVAFQSDLRACLLVTSGASARGVIVGTFNSVFTFDNALPNHQKVTLVPSGQTNDGGEEILEEYGLGIKVVFAGSPGQYKPVNITELGNGNQNNNCVMLFKDNTKKWLTGLASIDNYYREWIVSSKAKYTSISGPGGMGDNDYVGKDIDHDGYFSKILGGTWAPLRLTKGPGVYQPFSSAVTANITDGPFPSPTTLRRKNDITVSISAAQITLAQDGGIPTAANELAITAQYNGNKTWYNGNVLPNVDIVITSDVTKWSKCLVVESTTEVDYLPADLPRTIERPFLYKQRPSKILSGGKLVTTSDPTDVGFSYFPGYAIDVLTGERLNIFFAEASRFGAQNGDDMIWNPTPDDGFHIVNQAPSGVPTMGGKHYIYVTNSRYDSCKTIKRAMDSLIYHLDVANSPITVCSRWLGRAYASVAWVGIPTLVKGRQLLETDVIIRLRTDRRFDSFNPLRTGTNDSLNLNYPIFNFSTKGFATITGDKNTAKSALDLIRIVPNPYLAYSAYEQSQIDTRVRITNLPQKVKIKIFTLSGHLVRVLDKDDPSTTIDWDLRNTAGVPVASGVYIFHIDAPGIGEKVLKWFGVMRPTDLDSF